MKAQDFYRDSSLVSTIHILYEFHDGIRTTGIKYLFVQALGYEGEFIEYRDTQACVYQYICSQIAMVRYVTLGTYIQPLYSIHERAQLVTRVYELHNVRFLWDTAFSWLGVELCIRKITYVQPHHSPNNDQRANKALLSVSIAYTFKC